MSEDKRWQFELEEYIRQGEWTRLIILSKCNRRSFKEQNVHFELPFRLIGDFETDCRKSKHYTKGNCK